MNVTNKPITRCSVVPNYNAVEVTILAAFARCGAVKRGHKPPKHGVFSRMMRNMRKTGGVFRPESIHGGI